MRATALAFILVTVLLGLPAGIARASGALATCDEAHLLEALAGGGTVTFGCSGTIALAGTITIAADTTIDGSGQAITISGSDATRVFVVDRGATLNLNALTIAGGQAGQDRGGGVLNRGTLNVSNSTFAGNSGLLGAGIFNEAGTLRVSDSTLTGNSGGTGGAIWSTGGTVAISNSTFAGNTAAGPGGAIRNWSAAVTIVNSTFSGNSAGGLGRRRDLHQRRCAHTEQHDRGEQSAGRQLLRGRHRRRRERQLSRRRPAPAPTAIRDLAPCRITAGPHSRWR